MLIRLLVALLTLVGPMPFRVCTCAASAPAQTPADKPATATPTPPKRCGCVRCAPTKDVASAAGDTATHAGTHTMPAGDAPRSNQHERDCPATNPTPLVKDAGPPPAPILPTDCDEVHAVVLIESWPFAGAPIECRAERPRPPKLPLYLTLLSLRN